MHLTNVLDPNYVCITYNIAPYRLTASDVCESLADEPKKDRKQKKSVNSGKDNL